MKNKKLFIGIVAVAAVVCLNLRHAWRNYGIAENRIMAGAMADQTQQDSTCATKKGSPITIQDKKQIPKNVTKECVIAIDLGYYETGRDGIDHIIATVTYDLITGTHSQPSFTSGTPCSLDGLESKIVKETWHTFVSEQINCDGKTTKGACCYPKMAIDDCEKLLSGIS